MGQLLKKSLFKIFNKRFLFAICLAFASELAGIMFCYQIGNIINYLLDPEATLKYGITQVAIFAALILVQPFLRAAHFLQSVIMII